MNRYKPFNRLGTFLGVMGSAVAAASAVERGVAPEAGHRPEAVRSDPSQLTAEQQACSGRAVPIR
jgi:hypothetical protein